MLTIILVLTIILAVEVPVVKAARRLNNGAKKLQEASGNRENRVRTFDVAVAVSFALCCCCSVHLLQLMEATILGIWLAWARFSSIFY